VQQHFISHRNQIGFIRACKMALLCGRIMKKECFHGIRAQLSFVRQKKLATAGKARKLSLFSKD
jgi:hypothetical protein